MSGVMTQERAVSDEETPTEAPRSSVKRNVIANFFATGWTAIIGLAVLPLNVRFLGIESYALLGVFATMLALSQLLDAGLTPTLNRELARLSATPGGAAGMRTVVRTLEVVYWGIALLVGALVVALAPLVAVHWLNPAELSTAELRLALILMGFTLAVQWPASLYTGGLQGLQAQVQLSAITGTLGTLRSLGGVLVLWLVSPTVHAFFVWQAMVSAAQTVCLWWFLWRRLPPSGERARFSLDALRGVWRFAAGVTGHAVMRVLLTSTDKVILSRLLPLQVFGYYTLASTLAGALGRLVDPVFIAFFPRFSELVRRDDHTGLVLAYHRACQLVSVVVLPAAVVLGCFAKDVLRLWTGNPVIVQETHQLLTLLVAGTALNGLMYLPYALQLAHGWTRLTFWFNLIALPLLVPALVLGATRWGATGAALVWLGLNATYVLLQIPIMHRRLLTSEVRRWYVLDVAAPLSAAAAVAVGSVLALQLLRLPVTVPVLAAVSSCTLLAAALTLPWLREALSGVFRMVRPSTSG
jgi:O-antigen/teichoic acid export membrane protein